MKRMFRLFILWVVLFPILGSAETGPRLVCDTPTFEFGFVDQSAVVTNVFQVRNEGNTTFTLHHIKTACSCTRARIDRQMIGPGETAQVTVVFRAKRRRGPQHKSIKLIPIHAEKPALTLYMDGFVSSN